MSESADLTQSHRAIKQAICVLLFAFVVLLGHAYMCVRCFPTWASIWDQRPILQVDHALHLYHGSIGSQFLWEAGTTWGYDPFFMAGYPKTPYHDPSAGLADFSQFAVGGGYHPGAYKVGLLLTMLLAPLMVCLASRLMGFSPATSALSMLFYGWYYWCDFPKILLDTGLYSFLWTPAWVSLVFVATLRWHHSPTLLSWVLLALVTSMSLAVHPTTAIMVALPLVFFYLCIGLKHRWSWHFQLAAAVAVVVGTNLYWLVPMFRLWEYRKAGYVFMTGPKGNWFFWIDFYSQQPLALLLLGLGILGVTQWWHQGARGRAVLWGTTLVYLFMLTFYGSLWEGTKALEPLRFQVPLHLLACIPAASAMAQVLQSFLRSGWMRRTMLAAAGTLIAVYLGQPIFQRTWPPLVYIRPFPLGLTQPMMQLCDWIKTNTRRDSRIMVEDQLRLLEQTVPESLHWTCLLPYFTEYREYIGGQYQQAPLVHHRASFGDFHLGEQPIESLSPAQIQSFLDLYNVGTIIAWSPKSRRVLSQLTYLQQVAVLPRYTGKPDENRYVIFRYDRSPGYFLKGSGEVATVALNRIELRDLKPEKGEVILRYHYLPSFRTEPEVPINKYELEGDQAGFISLKLEGPVDQLVIRNSY